jgi:hypothetical protein
VFLVSFQTIAILPFRVSHFVIAKPVIIRERIATEIESQLAAID